MNEIRTTCPYCGVGCGLRVANGTLKGDVSHPANYGRLCSKGAALKDTLDLPDRLHTPTIAGRDAEWDEALDLIAQKFADTIRDHGPDSVAFYVSGQFLTEDYYVANKLMKGFIGSGNIDTNSRLCMASSVAAHVRAFGEDIVPGCYDDLEEADLVVLTGSNMAWCHPVLYQRLIAAREKRGTKIIVIDPRRTSTCETADLHLALKAGSDVALFSGLLVHLASSNAIDETWIADHVSGFAETLEAAWEATPSLDATADATGIAPADLQTFYDMFTKTERVMTLYSQGVNQSSTGTDNVNAVLNCHLATGRIGRAGMGPFSLTGQPNAMGGREVGGLANQLAAHMSFNEADINRVSRFWSAPNIATAAGRKAVDLFDDIASGKIKAVWIAATNPAVSMPRAGDVRDALKACPFVVVSDAWPTDTTALAHVVLPAAAWAEKDGTVTNSERRISRQRAFRAAPGSARPDWWMFAQVASRMGHADAFAFQSPADIFREHAALSAFENTGQRLFDIGALANLSNTDYDALEPLQWPQPKRASSTGSTRLFTRGGFPTPDGRARMIPLASSTPKRAPATLRLNTGRIRDQWHTMTRTGRVPHLMAHTAAPLIAMNPLDAQMRNIGQDMLVRISNAHGTALMRANLTTDQQPGDAFMPMHWTDEFASAAVVGKLVASNVDPVSGQPDLKGSDVTVTPVETLWVGRLVRISSALPDSDENIFWTKTPNISGTAFELSGSSPLNTVITSESALRRLLQIPASAELVSYSDPKKSVFRYAGFTGERLDACLYLAPEGAALPPRDLAETFLSRAMSPLERISLLAAATPALTAAPKEVICSCFGIDAARIKAAIRDHNLASVGEIGASLKAGTNCGSCIPELKKLLQQNKETEMAPAK